MQLNCIKLYTFYTDSIDQSIVELKKFEIIFKLEHMNGQENIVKIIIIIQLNSYNTRET